MENVNNACIEELVKLIKGIKKISSWFTHEKRLIIVFESGVHSDDIKKINDVIEKFTECHYLVGDYNEALFNHKNNKDYKTIYIELKENVTINKFGKGGNLTKENFSRLKFINYVNSECKEKFGSELKSKNIIFSFDKHSFVVYEFEATLKNRFIVTIKMIDGEIIIEPKEKLNKYKFGGNIKNQFEVTTYQVQYWESNSDVKIEYDGVDQKKAKKIFESFDTNDLDYDVVGEYRNSNNTYYVLIELNKKISTYEFVGEKGLDATDFPINDYYEDSDLYKLINEEEVESIDVKDVETHKSIKEREEKERNNNLNDDIKKYVKSICVEHKNASYLGVTFYGLKKYKDGFIVIRVADHFFNPQNIAIGKDVVWDSIEAQPEFTTRKNIFGFLSINILGSTAKDKKGFRKDFKYWDSEDTIDLIDYIDVNVNDEDFDWESEIDEKISEIESAIDVAIKNKVFEEEFSSGGNIQKNKVFKFGGNLDSQMDDFFNDEDNRIDETPEIVVESLQIGNDLVNKDYYDKIKKIPLIKKFITKIKAMNLYDLGWRFQFGTSRQWAGLCDAGMSEIAKSKTKNIYISIDFVKHDNNWKENSKSVILHEIAHAIVFEIFHFDSENKGKLHDIDDLHRISKGHGMVWKAVCKAISGGDCRIHYENASFKETFKRFRAECSSCENMDYGDTPNFTDECSKCGKIVSVEPNNS